MMFRLEDDVIFVELPSGKTMEELTLDCKSEIRSLLSGLYGKDIKLNGRLTTSMALVLGHELAHVTKSVSIFDPKENAYVLCIKH